MDFLICTPEEVMTFGKRVHLFPEPGTRARKVYYVQENHCLVQQSILWEAGQRLVVRHHPVTIDEIYAKIERVYSRETKGVLIARRATRPQGNRRQWCPLKKTGKGIGATRVQRSPLAIYHHVQHLENVVQRHQQLRVNQE